MNRFDPTDLSHSGDPFSLAAAKRADEAEGPAVRLRAEFIAGAARLLGVTEASLAKVIRQHPDIFGPCPRTGTEHNEKLRQFLAARRAATREPTR